MIVKKNSLVIVGLFIISVILLNSCGGSSFIEDGNGHKQYKNKEGNFVKNDWADVNEKRYYFDLNGYMVTDQWILNEYYVDSNGVMQTDYWYDDKQGHIYYLDTSGKYVKNLITVIDGNEYAFNEHGLLVINSPFVYNGQGFFFGDNGKPDKSEGWKTYGDTFCYINKDGNLIISGWKEDKGKWYYFNENGLMVKSSFVDGGYYVDENGEMARDVELKIGTDKYVFDSTGKGTMKARKINKDVVWGIREASYSKFITNDSNTKDKNKLMIASVNNEVCNVSVSVSLSAISFTVYPYQEIKKTGLKKYEGIMKTEDGQQIKIWYSSPITMHLEWGVILDGKEGKGETYDQLINLLCGDDDTKYTLYLPKLELTISSEICPGNFRLQYATVKDKVVW